MSTDVHGLGTAWRFSRDALVAWLSTPSASVAASCKR